jgi:hypothetical protein
MDKQLSPMMMMFSFFFAFFALLIYSGDSKMAFIVCVSAAAINADETFASLAFAARAVTVEQSKSSQKHIMHSPPAKSPVTV